MTWTQADIDRATARIKRGEQAEAMTEEDALAKWKSSSRTTQQRPSGAQVPPEGTITERTVEDITYAQRLARHVRERYSDGCRMEYITTILDEPEED